MSDVDRWYRDYWERLRARERMQRDLRAPCLRWYWAERLNDVEQHIFARTASCERILDYGAGDGALKKKFLASGFKGTYETYDLSPENQHTHPLPQDLKAPYDAILCLQVIEHMSLNAYVDLMDIFQKLLRPGGLLVISTANPLCIVPMGALDAGHIQQFPLADLAADLSIRGMTVEAFRYCLGERPRWPLAASRFLVQRALCFLLSVDYAQGILIFGRMRS